MINPDMLINTLIIIALCVWLFTCFFIVRGKSATILETFGRPHEEARMPGLQFKLPWPITTISGRINLQLQEIFAEVSVKSKDNAFLQMPVTVQYRASSAPQGAVKAFYELEAPEAQITSYILNNVRQTASGIDMIDLFSNRGAIENSVEQALSESFTKFGYEIVNVLVDEPQPSQDVEEAFNRVIASKREMEAAKNLAEAKRIELVGIAQAEKESKKLHGEGLSEMRKAIAMGLKEAMDEINNAGLNPEQSLHLLMDTNRLDTITNAASHGNVIVTDVRQGDDEYAKLMASVKAVENQKNVKPTGKKPSSAAKAQKPEKPEDDMPITPSPWD